MSSIGFVSQTRRKGFSWARLNEQIRIRLNVRLSGGGVLGDRLDQVEHVCHDLLTDKVVGDADDRVAAAESAPEVPQQVGHAQSQTDDVENQPLETEPKGAQGRKLAYEIIEAK